jgi:hypothetical protein
MILDSIQFPCSQARVLAGWRLETRLFTSLYAAEHFFIITLNGPLEKHRLLWSRIVSGVFTAPLYSNGHGADHIENSLYIVEACLPQVRVY